VLVSQLCQKKEGAYQDAYWATFSVATGKSTSKWQKLSDEGKKKPLSIRLVPSELLWAPTKSSVWPSDVIRKAVPLGEYNLPLQFEVNTGKTFGSDKAKSFHFEMKTGSDPGLGHFFPTWGRSIR
jgi:hypothetical protein